MAKHETTAEAVTPPGRVSVRQKLIWSSGAFVDTFMTNAIMYLAMPIYNIALGVDSRLMGWAIAAPRLWEAFTDPFMGNISDNTRSRWGRRRPYLFVGAMLCGVTFAGIWMPPAQLSQRGLAIFFFLASLLYYTSYTIYAIPWNAIGYELTTDFHERTRIMAYRTFVVALSGIFLGTLWWLSLRLGENEVQGARVVGILYGGAILVIGLIPAIFHREGDAFRTQEKIPLIKSFRCTLSNKPFLLLSGILLITVAGLLAVQPLSLYINIYYVFGGNKQAVSDLNMIANAAYQGAGLALVPFVAYMGTRFGKKTTLLVGLAMVIVGFSLSWVFYTPQYPYLQIVTLVLGSIGMTCLWVLSGSMIADICDVDELSTGLRREGMYGATFSWLFKTGLAATLVMSGYILNWVGYDPSLETAQSPDTIFYLRLLYAVVPAGFIAIAFVLTLFYPLTENRMREIREQLNLRNGKKNEREMDLA